MMMNILDQKAKEVQNHKQDVTENASTASEGNDTEDDRDSDDDVVMKEHYNIDKIDKFLNGTAKDSVTIEEAEEKKMSPETKKTRMVGRIEKLAQEVSHELWNISNM